MQQPGHALLGAAPAPAGGWTTALAGLLALAAAVGIGRFAFSPILPMMQEDAGLGVAQGGWLASANYAGYLAGALWALLHRVRPDYAVRSALLVTSAATMAMGLAEGIVPWLLLRAVAGISSAWALIGVTSWCVQRLAPLGRPVLNGMLFSGVGCGIVLAGLLCLALMAAGAGSRTAWLVHGVIGLAAAILAWPVIGVSRAFAAAPAAPRYQWTGDAVRLVLCYGAFGLGYIIPATFVPVMAKQAIHDPLVFGWAWPMFGLSAIGSTLLAAQLSRRMTHHRIWMTGCLLMAFGVVSPLLLPGLTGIALAALLVGGTFMVVTMAAAQLAREVAGPAAGVVIAAMTAAFALGQIAGPVLVSVLVERSHGFTAALVIACAALIASVVTLIVNPTPR
jgi:MFS family permease